MVCFLKLYTKVTAELICNAKMLSVSQSSEYEDDALMMEEIRTSEMMANFHETT
jgi:hypothetical protein